MGRIEATFAQLDSRREKALIPFLTAGDPDLTTTEALLHALVAGGADLIELGFPFSDPMADGPTIQASSERALASGANLAGILELVGRFRQHTNVPVILMGYYNPVFRHGVGRFAHDAASAGVDGLLLVDLPPEEADEVHTVLRDAGIRLITLLAPTTPRERAARLAASGEGYLYYVSMTGVTGSRAVEAAAIEGSVLALKGRSPVPVAVGFGIATPADVEAVGRFADAVVVGSALVRVIETWGSSPQVIPQVTAFVRSLKDALRKKAS